MQYSAYSQGADRAEAARAAGSGQHSRHQLSHLEAVDLPRKDQVGKGARGPPSRAGERDRPTVSQKAEPRGRRNAAWKFSQDQRAQPADRARGGDQVQRAARTGHAGDRRAAYYLHHYSRCCEGATVKAWGKGRGPGQIDRSDDFENLTRDSWKDKLAHVVPRIPAHHMRFLCPG